MLKAVIWRATDAIQRQHEVATVEPLITHTPRWTAQSMDYERSIGVNFDSVARKIYGL